MGKTLVIGASNIDIIGVSNSKIVMKDSNPGKIELVFGGVGKNIAENLYRLEEKVELLTFIGGGNFGKANQDYFKDLGIPFHHSIIDENKECGMYMAIHDSDGSISSGINDFSFIEGIQKEDFIDLEDYIQSFDILCFDTNLSEEVLTYLITKYKDKFIVVDGVSQVKAKRIHSVLQDINILKLNRSELSSLLDKPVDDVILGVKSLIELGLKHCIVTNGNEAITYNIEKRIYQTLVFEPTKIVSSVGAGDALLSGIIYGLNQGKSMHEALNYGKKAASYTMEVRKACNPQLSKKIIEE